MCLACRGFSRRAMLHGLLAAPLVPGPTRHGLVEPSLRLAPSPGRRVAVTLDACPGRFDLRVAGALVQNRIPATIFITAVWMRMNPQGLRFLLDHPDIFDLQNHGAAHLPPVLGTRTVYGLKVAGSWAAIQAEIEGGAEAVEKVTGRRPLWYRGAAGLYTPSVIPQIEALGVKVAGYSLNSDEGASLPGAIVAARIAAARDGEVIEGHINQPKRQSGAGIAAGLARLQGEGAQFATLA